MDKELPPEQWIHIIQAGWERATGWKWMGLMLQQLMDPLVHEVGDDLVKRLPSKEKSRGHNGRHEKKREHQQWH